MAGGVGWLRNFFFFFFKQKTAYEMRISDWSSDVCSSDLPGVKDADRAADRDRERGEQRERAHCLVVAAHQQRGEPEQDRRLMRPALPIAHLARVQADAILRHQRAAIRTEERRVGKEWVRTC